MLKKLFVIFIVVGFIIAGYTNDVLLYAKKLFTTEPTTHTIQRGEYLSRIAKQYYGEADYWRELALVNRSPNSNLIFPGEEIVVPRLDVIKEIRRTRWLSKVNKLMADENNILAHHVVGESKESEAVMNSEPTTAPSGSEAAPVATENIPEKSDTSAVFYTILGFLAIFLVTSVLLYIRKRQKTELSLIDDIDLENEKEDTEPDYRDYLRKRGKEKELTLY